MHAIDWFKCKGTFAFLASDFYSKEVDTKILEAIALEPSIISALYLSGDE